MQYFVILSAMALGSVLVWWVRGFVVSFPGEGGIVCLVVFYGVLLF